MDFINNFKNRLFSANAENFEQLALELFAFQSSENKIYRQYLQLLGLKASDIKRLEDIPFLPVSFFKSHHIQTGNARIEEVFESSGTSSLQVSRHVICDLDLYRQSFRKAFYMHYGNLKDLTILALLPSYLERNQSSLVYMVNQLMIDTGSAESRFYLDNLGELYKTLIQLEKDQRTYILWGVSFALLDFAEQFPFTMQHGIVMETGGMKGRQREMIREELQHFLCSRFALESIHSEYGMTELLSQAYSPGHGLFHCPPWMRIFIRDQHDPLHVFSTTGESGCINIIDLANIHSCAFIATDDLGKITGNSFQVLGRSDVSDIRGCNLLIQ
jgi:phenylacetate-coenzyme A ligase PaaK-like adenylate-forming protein